jgi:hypothetical protein
LYMVFDLLTRDHKIFLALVLLPLQLIYNLFYSYIIHLFSCLIMPVLRLSSLILALQELYNISLKSVKILTVIALSL